MRKSHSEKVRVFLVNWLFTTLYGMSLGEWLGSLRKHRFAVDPPYLPRAALMTLTGSITSLIQRHEDVKYAPKFDGARVERPIFILGHWRSGTTYLHRLFAADKRFAYPNTWEALNPHTFLSTGRYSGILELAGPKTRLIDDMSLDADEPFEDEFATCGTLCSPFLAFAFPRWTEHYDRYLTFRGVPEEEVADWKAALLLFYKKLSWKYGRPLVLKSPPHMCRIGLLLEMFPDARFVHIYRNPYAVFRSTKRQSLLSLRATRLQEARSLDVDAWIIRRYRTMYDAFFEERDLIPDGQFYEIRFEDLERDPVAQMRGLYEGLGIPGFETLRPSLETYVSTNASYRKNAYEELPTSLRREISQAWRRSFDEWNYPCD